MVRRKKKVSAEVVAKTKTIIVDYKKKNLDEFISLYQNKKLWLRFNVLCFIRVRVLEGGDSKDYENTLVKIIRVPDWIKTIKWGQYNNKSKIYSPWYGINKFEKIYVNYLSLYSSASAYQILTGEEMTLRQNLLVVESKTKQINKELAVIESIKTTTQKLIK